jgi:hypothetical protein
MNIKIFAKALRFACLPTLSILVLLFCGFFSISKTLAFISSSDGWAIALRVGLMIAEIALIYIMYMQYLEAHIKEEKEKENVRIRAEKEVKRLAALNSDLPKEKKGQSTHYHTEVYRIFENANADDNYVIYDTTDKDIKIIEVKRYNRN